MVEKISWKDIVKADSEELKRYCEAFDISLRGDEEELRERLIRRVLSVTLPSGEVFLEGKLNVNTATPEEMRIWPYMGETMIQNILDYRERYGKFNKVEDLLNVKGIGPNLLKKLMQFVDVTGHTHIKIKNDINSETDLEFIRLEEDIREKAWELKDMKEHMDIDMEYIGELMMDLENDMELLSLNLRDVEKFQENLYEKERELEELRENLAKHYDYLKGMEKKKETEYRALLEEAEALKKKAEEKLKEAEETYQKRMEELLELEKRMEEERKKIEKERDLLEAEKKELKASLESLEIEKKEIEDEKNTLEDERVLMEARAQELREKEEELKADLQRLEIERNALAEEKKRLEELMSTLEKKEAQLEETRKRMDDLEKKLRRLAFGVVGKPIKNLNELETKTVDIPVLVPVDPTDENMADDVVILSSTDGYIKRMKNISREGIKVDEKHSKLVFEELPAEKAYNILVDTGEERYYILKNFLPGGEE